MRVLLVGSLLACLLVLDPGWFLPVTAALTVSSARLVLLNERRT